MNATKNTGRRARNPYIPSMRRYEQHTERHRRSGQRQLSPYEALQQLVSRIVQSDLADADRLKYTAVALVEAKAHAIDAIRLFDRLAQAFARQVKHYRPIISNLAAAPPKIDEDDEQPSIAQSIQRKLHKTAMQRMSPALLNFLLDTPNNACPCCGRKE